MNGLMKKMSLGAVMAATVLAAAAPADAQRWRGYRGHRGGGNAAAGAILGGIVGLGVGAAIASNNNRRYVDRGYYGGGYGGGYYDRGYYDAPPPPRRWRGQGYYGGGYYQQQRCWTQWQYDPYYGDRVPVQVCN